MNSLKTLEPWLKGGPEAPAEDATAPPAAVPLNRIAVLGCPANEGDEVALRMLERLLAGSQFSLEITTTRALSSELVGAVRERGYHVVCIADLPPEAPSKAPLPRQEAAGRDAGAQDYRRPVGPPPR